MGRLENLVHGAVLIGCLGAGRAWADEIVIRIDLSDPSTYELVQPLRRECLERAGRAESAVDGSAPAGASATLDATRAADSSRAAECLRRRLLAGAELERVVRTFFPTELTPRELAFCVDEVGSERALLDCAFFWSRTATASESTAALRDRFRSRDDD